MSALHIGELGVRMTILGGDIVHAEG